MIGNGFEFHLPFDLTPAFPVIVVKDNERITTSTSANELTFQVPNSPFLYQFTDTNFDNRKGRADRNAAARIAFKSQLDQKLIDARDLMNPIDGWQRNHIYYGLTPTNPKGPFSLDFKETITSFRFNDGKNGYTKIAEQSGDPRIRGSYNSDNSTPPSAGAAWTDGHFEFLVNALVNAKSIGVPSTHKRFSADGYDLFDIEYELVFYEPCRWYRGCLIGKDLYVYAMKKITPKTFHPDRSKVGLINWDLDKYASTLHISIAEVDLDQVETATEKQSAEFAGNFAIDKDGIFKKIGLGFGASLKKSFESQRTLVTSLQSDELGYDFVEFGDKVIIREDNVIFFGKIYTTREYSTGYVSFSLEPVRVQD